MGSRKTITGPKPYPTPSLPSHLRAGAVIGAFLRDATTKRPRIAAASLVLAVIGLISGCAGEPSSAPQTPSAGDSVAPLTVVAIGDSIPYNSSDDCPNCTGFVDSYAQALSDQNGATYTAVNRSRHDGARTADILEEIQGGSLDEELSDAAVIIVSVGYNDQPPYDTGSCSDKSLNLDTAAGAADALVATTADCIADRTGAAGADLAGILKHARGLAPDARIVVLTAFNAWTGWSDFEALGAQTVRGASQTVATSLDAWRTTACEEAERIEGECVDLLTAFNGPDGLNPSGDLLAEDYTHPSQKGNDLIRDLLLGL